MSVETNQLSESNIGLYVEGCQRVALALDSAVSGVLETGKKPTILIPSRGAVPIYMLAAHTLRQLDDKHILTDRHRTRHYPDKIFDYLSDHMIEQNGPMDPQVEVVLYPFTADVTSEGKEETLAKQLRTSASRALLDLISGNRASHDLAWYFYLMNKMQNSAYAELEGDVNGYSRQEQRLLNPAGIVDSLRSLTSREDRQVILIDTVISGRASSQIIEAFNQLDHPVVPVLAVDEANGSNRFRKDLRSTIVRNMAWSEYQPSVHQDEAFVHFPLITEDKGAALLGLSAINFTNFNKPGFFHEADARIPADFVPQSCVWALPPGGRLRRLYGEVFHSFLEVCKTIANGEQVEERDLDRLRNNAKPLVAGHGEVGVTELNLLAQVARGTVGKESSSHIISITLPDTQAASWAHEFGRDFSRPGVAA